MNNSDKPKRKCRPRIEKKIKFKSKKLAFWLFHNDRKLEKDHRQNLDGFADGL